MNQVYRLQGTLKHCNQPCKNKGEGIISSNSMNGRANKRCIIYPDKEDYEKKNTWLTRLSRHKQKDNIKKFIKISFEFHN